MINLIAESILFVLVLFFLMPITLILAVTLHAVTDRKHKHGLSHREDGSGDVIT